MSKRLVHEARGYALVFKCGTWAFAGGGDESVAGRAFFAKYRDAVGFKRELAGHQIATRVVRVRVRMETE